MSWITPSVTDVTKGLSVLERTAYEEIVLADGATDPLPELLANAANDVRGYLAGAKYAMGADGTIPAQTLAACVAIATVALCSQLGIEVKEVRLSQQKYAVAYLTKVSRREVIIEEAATGVFPTGAQSQVISSRSAASAVTSDKMRGL